MEYLRKLTIAIAGVLFAVTICSRVVYSGHDHPDPPSVCYRMNRRITTETYSYSTYSTRSSGYSYGCGWWGRRCRGTRYHQALQVNYATRLKTVSFTEFGCCAGYRQKGIGTCEPVCDPPCIHGECISPGQCQCERGWIGYGCDIDVFECANNNANCEHICINTEGSYHCLCKEGYTLDADGHSCNDVDECVTGTHNCTGLAECEYGSMEIAENDRVNDTLNCTVLVECENFIGGFRCVCPVGYVLGADFASCEDYNECSANTADCNQVCTNTDGSYDCSCLQGYYSENDGRNCLDINECAVERGGCEHFCENKPGEFHCRCFRGYALKQDGQGCEEVICSDVTAEQRYGDIECIDKV